MNRIIPKSQLDAIINPEKVRKIGPSFPVYIRVNRRQVKNTGLVPTTFKVSPAVTQLLLIIAENENIPSTLWIETVVKFYAASKGYLD